MSDIIGPANAANAVTVRPAETRSFLSLDTWFKDCSGPLADDGTNVEASWLNGMLAWSRAIWRSNGNRLDGVTPVVPEVGTDDNGVLKAIQHLVQRGQVAYGEDTSGTANVITAALSPAPVEYKTGMRVTIKAANANTGVATLNLNGLGARTVKRPDGSNLLDSDVSTGSVAEYAYDGTYFQLQGASAQPKLVRNTTIYVNGAIGNDANDGTANVAGKALATIQGAVNLAFRYGPSPFIVTVMVAPGTYAGARTPLYAGPSLIVDGGSAAATTISSGTDYGFLVQGTNTATVQNVKAQNVAAAGGPALFLASSGAALATNNTASGACGGAVFQATGGGTVVVGTHSFGGNAYAFFWANFAGTIRLSQGATYTVTTPSALSVANAFVSAGGSVAVPSPSAPTWVNGLNVTAGQRYLCSLCGTIDSSGTGTNYFPAAGAGTTASGGQYA